jgi:hypothetical protein
MLLLEEARKAFIRWRERAGIVLAGAANPSETAASGP